MRFDVPCAVIQLQQGRAPLSAEVQPKPAQNSRRDTRFNRAALL